MQRKATKIIRCDSSPNMTPLVDVVMVILIFLMLAGSFGGSTHFIVSKQSMRRCVITAAQLKPDQPIDTPIEIHVDNAADLAGTGGEFSAQGTGITPTHGSKELQAQLETRMQQFAAAGTPADRLEVVLYPGRNVKYKSLIDVYQAALRARYTKVAFATSH